MASVRRKAEPVVKPPYHVPTMEEIRAVPKTGLKLVSTFSGVGGSCLGFRMAGFETLWASEFIPAARETYRKNFPGVPVDERDIRKVEPKEILKAIGVAKGEVDVLEGSPPCASFSMAGKREELWGQAKKYSQTTQRVDDLFFEFVRLLKGIHPRVFVAENVKGLTVGKAKGFFLEIKAALEACGYDVGAKVVDAQWLGVPQRRQRLIFMGVRRDLGVTPKYPKPFPYVYTLRDALPGLSSIKITQHFGETTYIHGKDVVPTIDTKGISAKDFYHVTARDEVGPSFEGYAIEKEYAGLAKGESSQRYLNMIRADEKQPSPTITAKGGSSPGTASVVHPSERRKFSIPELKRICSFPDDFELTGSYPRQWESCGRAVPPLMMYAIAKTIREEIFVV